MATKSITHKISSHVAEITEIIEDDISNLSLAGNDNDKVRNLKSLIDSLHKITNTLLQLRKLECSSEKEQDKSLIENNKKILREYLKKHSLNKE